jgi:hypothetical protein
MIFDKPIKTGEMTKKTIDILPVLKIFAWVSLIGYIVAAAIKLISFGVSFFNPEVAKNIYGSPLALDVLRQHSLVYFINVMSIIIVLAVLHAMVWAQIVKLLSSLNLKNPFSRKVGTILRRTGAQLLGIWVISVMAEQFTKWIGRHYSLEIGSLHAMHEYLFFAGIIYIISQVFKRGIEIQEENELTV